MKIPLQYQRSEYDCGPTALLNALSFLFHRHELPPDILKYVMLYSLDRFNQNGEACKEGTSQMAMMFLSDLLNQYQRIQKLPIQSTFLCGEQVQISENSQIVSALQQGGSVVLRVWYEGGHYITLTGLSGKSIYFFDPYYRQQPFAQGSDISFVKNKPCVANRKAKFSVFTSNTKSLYALENVDCREAVILFNTMEQKTEENTIEYYL